MERSAYVRTFILLVSIAAAHGFITFEQDGETVDLVFAWRPNVDYTVLYRVSENEDLLLANCSETYSPQPDTGYIITCSPEYMGYYGPQYTFPGSLSQTGHYRLERWTSGNNTPSHQPFYMVVCAQKMVYLLKTRRLLIPVSSESVSDVSSVELCRLNVTLGNGTTLRVYRDGDSSLVLDTSSSLEPLVEDLKGSLQLDLNSSRVILHGMSGEEFHCSIWREDQCLSYSEVRAEHYGHVFTHEGKNVTLPCTSTTTATNPHWTTPTAGVIVNQTHPQEGMHMLNGSQSGNYSLFILTVSKQHSGRYSCQASSSIFTSIQLSVFAQSSPSSHLMFSHRESVSIAVPFTLEDTDDHELSVSWYGKTDLQSEEDLLYSSIGFVQMPGWLRGRVSVNSHNYTLTISNLTAEDRVVFIWRKFNFPSGIKCYCTEGSIHLVYKDPFGVGSPFYWAYSPLLCAVLLGLVAAVVWVNMRSRKREPTSGPQSREGQQSGDEDLYDDVEVAEDGV
ncbi:uncharacterized protein LOC134447157 [Engraulis encrasicolus]|uniref:uncharacterized protein LOC134447157 n=1 Tax=Engraulis encrasicolus TaxID=184585 RepID=UPI002FD58CE0